MSQATSTFRTNSSLGMTTESGAIVIVESSDDSLMMLSFGSSLHYLTHLDWAVLDTNLPFRLWLII